MKTCLLILSILFSFLTVQAQEFAPQGSVWYYGVLKGAGISSDYRMFYRNGSTVVSGVSYKVISGLYNYDFLIRENGDGKLFMLASDGNEWLMWDRNAQVGDVWYYPYNTEDAFSQIHDYYTPVFSNPSDSIALRVEAIGDTLFNNIQARKIKLCLRESNSNSFNCNFPDFTNDAWFEPFGFIQTFFIFASTALNDSEIPIGLRCYQDDYWGLIHFNTQIACDSVRTIGIDDVNASIPIAVFPNPVYDELNFQLLDAMSGPLFVRIFDLQGRSVFYAELPQVEGVNSVNISFLSKGAYILKVDSPNRSARSIKLMKH
jgi:hypothetical protein